MTNKLIAFIGLSILLFGTACKKYEISSTEELTTCVEDEMDKQNIPAVAVIAFKNETILHEQYFGKANIENNVALGEQHLFLLASISKTITATALMQLYEQGKFQLDDPINNYLPFEVKAPEHSSTPITFRMLLTHTSSIADDNPILDKEYYYGKDSPKALKDFFQDYLSTSGQYYNAEQNFSGEKPGDKHAYSNIGSALIGVLVEQLSGKDFNSYCKQNIFTPLGMNNTAWKLAELDTALVVRPYEFEGGEQNPVPHYTFTDYPNGGLRTTAKDLAKFLGAYAQGGQYGGKTLLKSATITEMLKAQIADLDDKVGLHWFIMDEKNDLWGHDGGERGVSTTMAFNKETGVGVILLTNSDGANLDKLQGAVYNWALDL